MRITVMFERVYINDKSETTFRLNADLKVSSQETCGAATRTGFPLADPAEGAGLVALGVC